MTALYAQSFMFKTMSMKYIIDAKINLYDDTVLTEEGRERECIEHGECYIFETAVFQNKVGVEASQAKHTEGYEGEDTKSYLLRYGLIVFFVSQKA